VYVRQAVSYTQDRGGKIQGRSRTSTYANMHVKSLVQYCSDSLFLDKLLEQCGNEISNIDYALLL